MEFLPLCDVLFNIISLALYFCDLVFDIVLGYALYERGRTTYFAVVVVLVSTSLIVSQIVSVRWYLNKRRHRSLVGGGSTLPNTPENSIDKKNHLQQQNNNNNNAVANATPKSKLGRYIVIGLHYCQMGVLWRYAKLFIPVDLRSVKHEVRDLCMLRLVHAFCEAAPMLLLQLHVLVTLQNENMNNALKLRSLGIGGQQLQSTLIQQTAAAEFQQKTFKDLNVVSAILSLFSVCWALASFSKNVRLQNVHRLVLTWLGVIFQFLWRLGTVISRIASLTVYCSVYSYWVFLVIVLHWFSMFLWLISPKNVFHGERISRLKKSTLSAMIAFIYVFAYINLQEVKHRQKMMIFYVVMFLENCMLVCLWMVGVWTDRPQGWYWVPIMVFFSFAFGIFFMLVYYRYFHVRRLGYEAGGRSKNCTQHCNTVCRCLESYENGRPGCISSDAAKYSHAIPGVFNCRFTNPVNGATKRKKKKPTTFVPPPNLNMGVSANTSDLQQIPAHHLLSSPSPIIAIPFWRRPLPSHTGGSSENEGSSVGSRVNIQQKLQEKKQKQLAELKIIEEEIKQGKLVGPSNTGTLGGSGEDTTSTLPRQPIPRAKKHIDIEPIEWRTPSPEMGAVGKSYDLNMMLSANLDDVNNLNKYSSNYDPIYNSFGLNGMMNSSTDFTMDISALAKFSNEIKNNIVVENANRMSSPISAAESNSLTRQVVPRAKMPHNIPRNPFAENYRGNFVNMYAEAAANRPPSISPRNTANSPNRTAAVAGSSGVAQSNGAPSAKNLPYDRLYLDANHPRQVSGTYSSIENTGGDNNLPMSFPYNVVPPPKSKLESRATPTAPIQTASAALKQQNQMPAPPTNNLNVMASKLTLTQRQLQRSKTPEVLLSPHYLDNSRVYYDWMTRGDPVYRPTYRIHENDRSSGDENLDDDPNRMPSDIDSQVSLPRSYTLPREFKYYRRNKGRKTIKNEHFIASTNSSDGDVDSCDDNESEHRSNLSNNSQQQQQPAYQPHPRSRLTPTIVHQSSNMRAPYMANSHMNNFNNLAMQEAGNESSASQVGSHWTSIRQNPNINYNLLANNNKHVVNNLDLINGVVETNILGGGGNMGRANRLRNGGRQHNMVRHETKL